RTRARADGQVLDYGLADLARIALAARSCPYCGRALLTPEAAAFDHDMPTALDTSPAAYSLRNVVVCCRPCNESKGILTGAQFRALLQLLEGFGPRVLVDVLARLRAGGRRYARGRGAAS